jgi:excinuclease ABC subunit A
MDVIAAADHIIDLGPEGGEGGGRIVAQGPPEEILRAPNPSHTAKWLKRFLRGAGNGQTPPLSSPHLGNQPAL